MSRDVSRLVQVVSYPFQLVMYEKNFIYREKEISAWVPDSWASLGIFKDWSPFCRSQDLD